MEVDLSTYAARYRLLAALYDAAKGRQQIIQLPELCSSLGWQMAEADPLVEWLAGERGTAGDSDLWSWGFAHTRRCATHRTNAMGPRLHNSGLPVIFLDVLRE